MNVFTNPLYRRTINLNPLDFIEQKITLDVGHYDTEYSLPKNPFSRTNLNHYRFSHRTFYKTILRSRDRRSNLVGIFSTNLELYVRGITWDAFYKACDVDPFWIEHNPIGKECMRMGSATRTSRPSREQKFFSILIAPPISILFGVFIEEC